MGGGGCVCMWGREGVLCLFAGRIVFGCGGVEKVFCVCLRGGLYLSVRSKEGLVCGERGRGVCGEGMCVGECLFVLVWGRLFVGGRVGSLWGRGRGGGVCLCGEGSGVCVCFGMCREVLCVCVLFLCERSEGVCVRVCVWKEGAEKYSCVCGECLPLCAYLQESICPRV